MGLIGLVWFYNQHLSTFPQGSVVFKMWPSSNFFFYVLAFCILRLGLLRYSKAGLGVLLCSQAKDDSGVSR